jgi:hypothetical protein
LADSSAYSNACPTVTPDPQKVWVVIGAFALADAALAAAGETANPAIASPARAAEQM